MFHLCAPKCLPYFGGWSQQEDLTTGTQCRVNSVVTPHFPHSKIQHPYYGSQGPPDLTPVTYGTSSSTTLLPTFLTVATRASLFLSTVLACSCLRTLQWQLPLPGKLFPFIVTWLILLSPP